MVAGIAKDGTSETARLTAAHMLWERGWGKPQQDNTLEIKGEIKVVLRKMLEDDGEDENKFRADTTRTSR